MPQALMAAELSRMSDALRHRGPDSGGFWCDETSGVGLGHRRLSVIDPSDAGNQPMHSRSGRWVLVYNGELYNAEQLRAELIRQVDHYFRGRSDTEVLVEALSAWGIERTLPRLRGMFALAAFDRDERTLHLARDRLGIKPLYFGRLRGRWLFASELGAIRKTDGFRPELDRDVLASYMRYGAVHGGRSILAGVRRLGPGQRLSIRERNGTECEQYWSPVTTDVAQRRAAARRSYADTVTELHALLEGAVRSHLVSDVPLGAFLSGGIDSSLIVALAQRVSSRPMRTFTIGFTETAYDESTSAAAVARALGTDHTTLMVTPREALRVIPRLPQVFDEPFADASQIPTLLLCELTRQSVTVALSGDGGDELFGGYNRHLWAPRIYALTHALPPQLRLGVARFIEARSPQAWDRLMSAIAPALLPRYRHRLPGSKLYKIAKILRTETPIECYRGLCSHGAWADGIVLGSHREAAPWCTRYGDEGTDFAEVMMGLDLLNYLPDDILTKVDRASMAFSLEARVPYLDNPVVEYALSLPIQHRLRRGVGKAPLRDLLARYLPRALFERPKMGFGLPLGAWLRGPLRDWAEALLSDGRLVREGWFDSARVRELWQCHLLGRIDAEHQLWPILMFHAWLDSQP